ncbi:MAG: hypothetical protein ACREHG_01780 [Candidatus Saccharimonadales bacterium]
MRDYAKQVENDVKGLIAEACLSMGINKDDAGYCIGGYGVIAPQILTDPETGNQGIGGFAPSWQIAVGLRSHLLGTPPIIKSLPVFGVVPDCEALKPAVYRLVQECDKDRQAQ